MSDIKISQSVAHVEHKFNDQAIRQRSNDGYFDATAMCKVTGKRWNNYHRANPTQEFLKALSSETGLPVYANPAVALKSATEQNQGLIQIAQGGDPQNQGTWVHPHIAINLAQWCSPQFAVQVSKWVFELMNTGKVELEPQVPRRQLLDFGYISLKWESTFLTAKVVERYFERGQCVSASKLKVLTERVSAVNIAVINLDAATRNDSQLIPLFSDCCPSCGYESKGGVV